MQVWVGPWHLPGWKNQGEITIPFHADTPFFLILDVTWRAKGSLWIWEGSLSEQPCSWEKSYEGWVSKASYTPRSIPSCQAQGLYLSSLMCSSVCWAGREGGSAGPCVGHPAPRSSPERLCRAEGCSLLKGDNGNPPQFCWRKQFIGNQWHSLHQRIYEKCLLYVSIVLDESGAEILQERVCRRKGGVHRKPWMKSNIQAIRP